jgi:hypothetical protein
MWQEAGLAGGVWECVKVYGNATPSPSERHKQGTKCLL